MPRLFNNVTRYLPIAFGLWLASAVSFGFANSSELLSTNDLNKRSDSVYEVSGIDPFFVVELSSKAFVEGDIVVDLGKEISGVKLELFFENRDSFFDPFYKASYLVERFPVRLKLPSGALKSRALRIDLVDCASCQLDLSNVIGINQLLLGSSALEPVELLNGLKQLEFNGQRIDLNDWRMNDLKGALSKFEITAGDPYLVSPKLNLNTNGLAGIYFRLNTPDSDKPWDDYQFFYQTEHHGFSVKASSSMRVSQRSNGKNLGVTELFLPLGFLSEDFPPSKSLEQIRLDLPLIAGSWGLLESKLIHENELEQYLAFEPKQLVHTKLQRATGLRLLNKAFSNVWADRGFVITYLLLILTVIALFVRAYRRDN